MKDTKGVRQVLEDFFPSGKVIDKKTKLENEIATVIMEQYRKSRIDTAEATLQEIMLGTKPKEPGHLKEGTDYSKGVHDGYMLAIKDWEQNIRGGFNNG